MSRTEFLAHLGTGTTTVCRAWTITRRDGSVLGFTDHDADIVLDGVAHMAATGLTAGSLQSSSGLSVDNQEVLGALSSASITEKDLSAGRYDGADVRVRLVNWAEPSLRMEIFRGSIGEVVRTGAEFKAELRGLSEALNQPVGQAYTRKCSAVLGDARCRFDLTQPGYSVDATVARIEEPRALIGIQDLVGHDDRWFEGGRLEVLSGEAAGLVGMIKSDRQIGTDRELLLWQTFRGLLKTGDTVRLLAGCDKSTDTCRLKFSNLLNFRGFPFIPGEDWLSSYPRAGQPTTGGSLTGP